MTEKTKSAPVMVRALQRGLDILECLADAAFPMSLKEIAEHTEVSPATALRILNTLEERGFVHRREAGKKYSLGEKCFRMRESALQGPPNLREAALPHLQTLADAFDESVSLYIAVGQSRVCLERIESSRALRTAIAVGDSMPLTAGAGGRALLAWQSEEDVKKQFAGNFAELGPALKKIRQEGYVVSHGEREEGVSAVAAPVFGHGGALLAALSVAGPSTRFTPELVLKIIAAVTREAKALSLAMQRT